MNYYFTEEYFNTKLIAEISPLTEKSWREANCAPDSVYDPNWEEYSRLNDQNLLRLYTVRTEADSDLVGYATFLVCPTLHSMNIIHAMHDSLYILKKNRKNGTVRNLIAYIEKEMVIANVDTMAVTIMTHRDFSPTLKELGFTHSESTYIKRLK